MRISVIIPTMNRSHDLRRAIESVRAQELKPHEVLVVDQSADTLTREACHELVAAYERQGIHLRYLRQEKPSLVRARNAGLEAATGDVICYLDDDVVLLPDFLRVIDDFMRDHPEVGALSGNVILRDRPQGLKWNLRSALMRIFLISDFDGRMTPSGFGYPIYERQLDRLTDVEMLQGCNMIFRRSVLDGERFDEWFSGYSYREDAEFSYRISQRTRTVIVPGAKLYHHHSSSNRLAPDQLKRMQLRNYYYVFRKYKGRSVMGRILFAYSMLGILLIDLLECLSGSEQKIRKFRASLDTSFELLTGRAR